MVNEHDDFWEDYSNIIREHLKIVLKIIAAQYKRTLT
jgi:hypothetical protein